MYPVSALRKALVLRENLIYAFMYLATVLLTNIMYWTACLSDPGFVPLNPVSNMTMNK